MVVWYSVHIHPVQKGSRQASGSDHRSFRLWFELFVETGCSVSLVFFLKSRCGSEADQWGLFGANPALHVLIELVEDDHISLKGWFPLKFQMLRKTSWRWYRKLSL